VLGEYPLADETYEELLEKLSGREVSAALRADLVRHFGAVDTRVAALK